MRSSFLLLPGPRRPGALPPRRGRVWPWTLVGAVVVPLGYAGLEEFARREAARTFAVVHPATAASVSPASAVSAGSPSAPLSGATPLLDLDSRALVCLAEIRAAAQAAQLEVRVSIPLVAERGLPVTVRRLQACDAQLSTILQALERVAAERAAAPVVAPPAETEKP